jgi:hypothetical protein
MKKYRKKWKSRRIEQAKNPAKSLSDLIS